MNLDDSNNESIEENDVKFVETLTKKNQFKLKKSSLVQIIDKNQFVCYFVCFDCQFQDSNSKQFSEKTIIKKEVSCLIISDFNFKNLNSNHLKTALHSFFKFKFKKIIEDSVSSLNQIIKTLKSLKYMIFLK